MRSVWTTVAGQRLGLVQIAGLVARRIVCKLEDGQNVRAGERYGLIRFGSRVDLYLPGGCRAAGGGRPARRRRRNRAGGSRFAGAAANRRGALMARRPRPPLGAHSINRLIPNSLTLLALCAGITAMRFAIEGRWDRAVIAIVVAAVLDGLDGRIARALGATSRFGAELDFLSDFVCFGVAPAVVVYMWSLQDRGRSRLGAVSAVRGLLRAPPGALQRGAGRYGRACRPGRATFSSACRRPPAAASRSCRSSSGCSSSTPSSPRLGSTAWCWPASPDLMVSRLPTFAFKRLKVPGRHVVLALLAVGAFAAFLISTPWVTLAGRLWSIWPAFPMRASPTSAGASSVLRWAVPAHRANLTNQVLTGPRPAAASPRKFASRRAVPWAARPSLPRRAATPPLRLSAGLERFLVRRLCRRGELEPP